MCFNDYPIFHHAFWLIILCLDAPLIAQNLLTFPNWTTPTRVGNSPGAVGFNTQTNLPEYLDNNAVWHSFAGSPPTTINIGTTAVTGGSTGFCLTNASGVVGNISCGGGLTVGATPITGGVNGNCLTTVAGLLGVVSCATLAAQPYVFVSSGTGQFGLAIATNTQLTVPGGTVCAEITLEASPVRRTSDGTSPTSTNGTLIEPGTQWQDCGPLTAYKFTAVSGAPTFGRPWSILDEACICSYGASRFMFITSIRTGAAAALCVPECRDRSIHVSCWLKRTANCADRYALCGDHH